MRWALVIFFALWAQGSAAETCGALRAFLAGEAGDLPGASCRESLTETGPGRACFWAYPYRSEGAYGAFAAAVETFVACVPEAEAEARPDGVNHPDTHDVRIFAVGADRVTISLKDKARLGQTLVFVIVDFGAVGG